ncbi:hypothetical protein Taro_005162 [Colocasia esculenta]|uniref:Retrotransposon gag domain-containing protein n=1 Tax=Colocasia esculenta TaxID=4460 RepID=A0A843TS89_COLES|nr:hypothetical protein [Colocasia esculenta]
MWPSISQNLCDLRSGNNLISSGSCFGNLLPTELNGQLAAVKIPGWWHDLVPLTHVGGSICAAKFNRRGVPTREDEQRREDREEQQAPAPQCPTVLPPPPPVDYGVFMQGLVQAMQTQAHTQAALQAQLEAQAQALSLVPQEHGHGGPSIMERFKRMAPPYFKGESQPLLAESWMREIEKIFRAIRCAEEHKVSLATYMLQERADVWWSSLLRTRFEDGTIEVAWDEFVRLFPAKFIPEHI